MGQGGFTSHEFVQAIGEPVTIALRSAIPLETDLEVVVRPDQWRLVDPLTPDTIIMEATRWVPDYPMTTPVTIDQAERARQSFALTDDDHPAPHCLSCGTGERSLRVHAGPLGDGRWATPFRLPEWSMVEGLVDTSLLWMAMDCSCGWYIQQSTEERRHGLTVQFAVDVHAELHPETDYALVAWHGDGQPGWDGRKRGAAAALFDEGGQVIASCKSFWVSPT